ncbi:MAG: hypothetical protein PUA56_00830 [Bacillales bacterium]|nr:hypothetical protein [Bacillales bacterium]
MNTKAKIKAHLFLGNIQFKYEKWEEAQKQYLAAKSLAEAINIEIKELDENLAITLRRTKEEKLGITIFKNYQFSDDPEKLVEYSLFLLRSEEDLRNKAIELLGKAIKIGSSRANFILGDFYLNGYYLEKNTDRAMEFFTQGSKSNDDIEFQMRCLTKITKLHLENKEYDNAIESLIDLSNKGSDDASYSLAMIYKHGRYGINKDAEKYFDYITRVDNYMGYYELGSAFLEGKLIEKDIDAGIVLLEKCLNEPNYIEAGFLALKHAFNNQNEKEKLIGSLIWNSGLIDKISPKEFSMLSFVTDENEYIAIINGMEKKIKEGKMN